MNVCKTKIIRTFVTLVGVFNFLVLASRYLTVTSYTLGKFVYLLVRGLRKRRGSMIFFLLFLEFKVS